MSARLFPDDVVFRQRFLKCCGLYQGRLDGRWGPKTDAASAAFDQQIELLAQRWGRFDPGSERRIASLLPQAQEAARRSLRAVLDAGIPARIISGTRTYEEQNLLYRQGRFGNPGKVVTRARGGQSNHNFGIAWDLGVFDQGRYLGESPLYTQAGPVGRIAGVEWGGDWTDFPDRPHFQLATGAEIGAVRARFESGTAFV
jgi:peptidoglycan L-alanyl-D-glutamate endopeptidase CwlK